MWNADENRSNWQTQSGKTGLSIPTHASKELNLSAQRTSKTPQKTLFWKSLANTNSNQIQEFSD